MHMIEEVCVARLPNVLLYNLPIPANTRQDGPISSNTAI